MVQNLTDLTVSEQITERVAFLEAIADEFRSDRSRRGQDECRHRYLGYIADFEDGDQVHIDSPDGLAIDALQRAMSWTAVASCVWTPQNSAIDQSSQLEMQRAVDYLSGVIDSFTQLSTPAVVDLPRNTCADLYTVFVESEVLTDEELPTPGTVLTLVAHASQLLDDLVLTPDEVESIRERAERGGVVTPDNSTGNLGEDWYVDGDGNVRSTKDLLTEEGA